jgi:hypothetical protein
MGYIHNRRTKFLPRYLGTPWIPSSVSLHCSKLVLSKWYNVCDTVTHLLSFLYEFVVNYVFDIRLYGFGDTFVSAFYVFVCITWS